MPQFTRAIRHISGQDTVLVDVLSHAESDTAPPSYDALAASKDSNDELRTLLGSNNALWLKKLHLHRHPTLIKTKSNTVYKGNTFRAFAQNTFL
jgi:hypothetical protein